MWTLWGKMSGSDWEEIDTAETEDKDYLLGEYRMAFGPGWVFKWRKSK